MRILHIGDGHFQGNTPIARKCDDYIKMQLNKWNEIIDIANYYNVPVVCPGDICNSSNLSNSLLTKFGNVFHRLYNPLYFTWGNHDLLYHSLDLWDRTALGVLWKNNANIRHISEFHKDHGVLWDWCDWGCDIQNNGADLLLMHKAVYTLAMVHGESSWIIDDKAFGMPISDDCLKQYKIVICGHWHKQYILKYKKNNRNIIVFNSGCIVRRTIKEQEIPAVKLINLDNRTHKIIKLKTALPSELVLSSVHLDSKIKNHDSDTLQFINKLSESQQGGAETTYLDNITQELDKHTLDPEVEMITRDVLSKVLETRKDCDENNNRN